MLFSMIVLQVLTQPPAADTFRCNVVASQSLLQSSCRLESLIRAFVAPDHMYKSWSVEWVDSRERNVDFHPCLNLNPPLQM